MFRFPGFEIPTRVQIVISPDWVNLLTASATAQFLPFAEVLGALPGSQPSGAWARVVGLALMNFWRCNPAAALSGELQPTRAELLQRYTPKIWPVEDLLVSKTPKRVLVYWHSALQLLADKGLVERTDEVAITPEEHSATLPRYNWGGEWLEGRCKIIPGEMVRDALEGRSRAIQAAKPRGRGRPRKT